MGNKRAGTTINVGGTGQRVAGRQVISGMTIRVGNGVRINGVGNTTDGDIIPGSGRLAREARQLPAFDRIEVASCVDVEVVFGTMQKVEVEADDNLLALVETEVQGVLGHSLRVDVRGSLSTENKLIVRVELPVPLQEVTIAGSGDASVLGLQQESIDFTVRGSGNIRAAGEVRRLHALVQGSGDLKLRGLRAAAAELTVQGSGDIAAEVTQAVTAWVVGSGDITVLGSPEVRQTRVQGSGDIEFE